MSVAVSLGGVNPGGTGVSITYTSPLAGAAPGDFVMVNFGWAVAGGSLIAASDPLGNTWTPVSHDAANQSGGYYWTIVTTGWAAGALALVGSLASGTPGGRVATGLKIPAGVLAGSPIDTHIEGAVASPPAAVSITGPSPLAQSGEVVIVSSIVRESTGNVPSWTWLGAAAGVVSITGSGTTTAGAAFGELDNTPGSTTPPTVSYTPKTTAGNHGLGMLTLKLAPVVVAAPLAQAVGSGFSPVGGAMVAHPPLASAAAVGFPASVQLGPPPVTTPGFSPPWRPYFEQRDGIGFGQG